MHPLILELPTPAFLEKIFGPSLKLHWYGVLIGIGFMLGLFLVTRRAKKEGENPEVIFDDVFWTFVWGLVGARVLFILIEWEFYLASPLEILKVWNGGIVFYGGFIGGLIFSWYNARRHKLNMWKIFDIKIPALALAHVFGRLGCLAAGCCFGRPTDLGWAIHYPKDSMAYAEQIHQGLLSYSAQVTLGVHPAPLYDALGESFIFLFLLWVAARKRFHGQVLLTWMVLYAIQRSIVETFRGDTVRKFVIPGVLSTSQFISIGVFALAIFLLINRLRARAKIATQ